MDKFKTPFVNAAIASKNENALIFAISNNLIKKADHDKILDVAKEIGSSALKGAALGSSAKPTQKEREKKAEKELDKALGLKPLSVADIKKLWEYRVDDDGNITLTKYIGKELIPSIPAKVGKATVTRIGNKAFACNSTITAVYIPEGVVAIGDFVFDGCIKLETVELSKSTIFVGADAFRNCKVLSKINFTTKTGEEVEINRDYCRLDEIKSEWKYEIDVALNTCRIDKYVGNKVDICIPDRILGATVTEIYRNCFSSGLTFGGDGSGAQQKHNRKIKSIHIPESVELIGDSAFAGCKALQTINIPDGCKVEKHAFLGCKKLTQDGRLVIINDVLYRCVDPYAIWGYFGGNEELYEVVIPSNVKEIADCAFENCQYLSSVEIPNSVTKIGREAFAGRNSLTNINLPDSICYMGYHYWNSYKGSMLAEYDNCVYTGNEENPYLVLVECKDKEIANCKVHSHTRVIGSYAFDKCEKLSNVELPKNLKGISSFAFHGCKLLSCIEIPDSVLSIDEYAFSGCSSLESIKIPTSVTAIYDKTFEHCTSLTSIELHDGIVEIGKSAFAYCSLLKNIQIPNQLKKLRYEVFAYCNSLEKVTIPESIVSIDIEAFRKCGALNEVAIPKWVKKIAIGAFKQCSNLALVKILGIDTEIEDEAFVSCGNLTIQSTSGSKAESYAKKNGIKFEVI